MEAADNSAGTLNGSIHEERKTARLHRPAMMDARIAPEHCEHWRSVTFDAVESWAAPTTTITKTE
jgi:hypothetical protein